MCRNSRPSKPRVQTLALSSFIQKKCKSTLKNVSICSLLNKKFKKTIKNGSTKGKRQRNQMSSKQNPRDCEETCSKGPSIIDLLTMIGERDQSNTQIGTKDLHRYADRDVLKISSNWSKTISTRDNTISLEVDSESNVTDILIKSLSPDCACLEVEAMSLLAYLEHELDENIMELPSSASLELYDDEMEDEILRLDEAEASLERELCQIDALDEIISAGSTAMKECIVPKQYDVIELEVEQTLLVAAATTAACA